MAKWIIRSTSFSPPDASNRASTWHLNREGPFQRLMSSATMTWSCSRWLSSQEVITGISTRRFATTSGHCGIKPWLQLRRQNMVAYWQLLISYRLISTPSRKIKTPCTKPQLWCSIGKQRRHSRPLRQEKSAKEGMKLRMVASEQ